MFVHEVGSGTPLVLLHGFGVDHRILLPLEPALERAGGWQRLYVDLPGATGSPNDNVSSAQQVAEAAMAEVQSLVGTEPFAILGNSFGAMIGRYIAHELRSQVLGLATLAGVFVSPSGDRALPTRVVLRRDSQVVPVLGDVLDDYREMAVVESVQGANAFLEYVLPGVRGAHQADLERIAESYALTREPEDAHPTPFLQPSLHITGRQDHVVGYRDAWNRIEHYPHATFVTLDAAGHNVHLEQPKLCAALVRDWLARIRSVGSA
jgi:pimeloyl-ACP methyl ester carboxylesterase